MVFYGTPDSPLPAGKACFTIEVPDELHMRAAVIGALQSLVEESSWEVHGQLSIADTVDALRMPVYNAQRGEACRLIGEIKSIACAEIPAHFMACWGQTVLRVDMPLLYDAIHPSFHIDADSFLLPDLKNKFPFGDDDINYPFGPGSAGEFEVALTVEQLAPHSHHDSLGHNHSEGIATPSVINGGVEAPAPAAQAGVSATGPGYVVLDNTGDGSPHNNMPPFSLVRYVICYE